MDSTKQDRGQGMIVAAPGINETDYSLGGLLYTPWPTQQKPNISIVFPKHLHNT